MADNEGEMRRRLNEVEAIRRIFTPYPLLVDIKVAMTDLVNRDNSAGGVIHMLVGESRAGKTRFLEDLKAAYPAVERGIVHANGDFARSVPVAVSRVPRGGPLAVVSQIYQDLAGVSVSQVLRSGFRRPAVESEIVRVARECGTKLLILEETHQSFEEKGVSAAVEVAIILKDLVNAKLFSILVVGVDRVLDLLGVNNEFKSRCVQVHRIQPLNTTKAGADVWADILEDIDAHLEKKVFGRSCGLHEPKMASRLMIAAEGVVGHMATLVELAASRAVRAADGAAAAPEDARTEAKPGKGKATTPPKDEKKQAGAPEEHFMRPHFEAAFASWGSGLNRTNPFSVEAWGTEEPPSKEERVDEGPASGVIGRSKGNHRDTEFRK